MSPNLPLFDEFERLAAAVIDETALPEDVSRFNALLRDYPELVAVYFDQVRMHAMLEEKGNIVLASVPTSANSVIRSRMSWWRGWRIAAAAIGLLLIGAEAWKLLPRFSKGEKSMQTSEPVDKLGLAPLKVVAWKGAWGFAIPEKLPGNIRFPKGEITVRLSSGVELTLLGPVDLDVQSSMDVWLRQGRLLAWVPSRASGFTVNAPGLTIWDVGTVFTVASQAEHSETFVFKGCVQVLDDTGEAVDLCHAGEGVRASKGKSPFKVAVEDNSELRELYAAVDGYSAMSEPQKTFEVARQIGDSWVAKNAPKEASRIRAGAEGQVALRNALRRAPFTKAAWVRSTGFALQERTKMKKSTGATAVLAAAVVTLGTGVGSATSESVLVDTSPVHNRRWMTVYTNEVPLSWDWMDRASHAKFAISGMNSAFATNFTGITTNWLWRAFASDKPSSEDVYELSLVFYDNGDTIVGSLTSRLAVVKSAFGGGPVDPRPVSTRWQRIKTNVVLPYDADWTEASSGAERGQVVIAKVGGTIQTNALPDGGGYFGWQFVQRGWGYGTFNLALSFPETVTNEWDATLVRLPDGVMISVK